MTAARPAPEGAVGRLLARADFVAAAKGKRAATAYLTLQALPRPAFPDAAPRLGLTVTKKAGGAVERNRIRRRLRAAVRQVAPIAARPGHDYVIVARRNILDAAFADLIADLDTAFRRVHAAKPGPARV